MGPVLAAQFGYLPGTLWIIIGAVLGGAVQDFVILFASMRRDGKSLGQMAREEIGKAGGFAALVTVLLIMIIMLAVMALVVVNALQGQPVGHVHHRGHHAHRRIHGPLPALLAARQGAGMLRPSASCWWWRRSSAGDAVAQSPALAPVFTLGAMALAAAIIVYGFLASALPVWLLLAPRDYLSTFVKLGVMLMLASRGFCSSARSFNFRRSRVSWMARGRSSPAKSSPSASSPSPAAPFPDSTR